MAPKKNLDTKSRGARAPKAKGLPPRRSKRLIEKTQCNARNQLRQIARLANISFEELLKLATEAIDIPSHEDAITTIPQTRKRSTNTKVQTKPPAEQSLQSQSQSLALDTRKSHNSARQVYQTFEDIDDDACEAFRALQAYWTEEKTRLKGDSPIIDPNVYQEPGEFALLDLNIIEFAKFDEKDSLAGHVARPQQKLVIPWLANPKEFSWSKDDFSNMDGQATNGFGPDGHIFLAVIELDEVVPQLSYYDSCPTFLGSRINAFLHTASSRKNTKPGAVPIPNIESVVRRFGYGKPGISFRPDVRGQTARQFNDVTCGIHAILNGWAVAMNLTLNSDFQPPSVDSKVFYRDAADVITLALAGCMDAVTIYAFFLCSGYVERIKGHEARYFERTMPFRDENALTTRRLELLKQDVIENIN